MFKAIHGITPNYLSDRIDMHFDIHGYDTREDGSIELVFIFQLSVHKEIYRFFFYLGGKLWNDLPNFLKNFTNIEILNDITGFIKV